MTHFYLPQKCYSRLERTINNSTFPDVQINHGTDNSHSPRSAALTQVMRHLWHIYIHSAPKLHAFMILYP